jgi:4-hydroxy-4-methyl-2-oxoglutarate aldolase
MLIITSVYVCSGVCSDSCEAIALPAGVWTSNASAADSRKGNFMAVAPRLTLEDLDSLRSFDTCMIANAVEKFNVRLRNTGFTDASIRCIFEDAPPMVGYAATARLRSGEPPIGGGTFHDRSDFWNKLLETPSPRILVLEDMDHPPGRGAFIGDVHAAILKALGCVGYLTNGAVRELPAVRASGIQVFAGNVAVSHAYAHIFDIGAQISVGGMDVRPDDLLHGDRHGVVTIPAEIAGEVSRVAAELQEKERKVVDFCRSSGFSVAKLGEVIKTMS